jgi:serine protease Do
MLNQPSIPSKCEQGFALRASLKALATMALSLVLCLPLISQAQMRGLPDFTELVEQVGPSVVNIRTSEKIKRGSTDASPDQQMQELLRRFFGDQAPGQRQQRPRPNRPQEEERPTGVGSGFIVSADGYIMTNAHVVDGADQVLVTLPDKREFKAKIVGLDKRSDVALVKIEATGLPAVRTGDVNRIKVGEWVMAIGSPFGLESTVTAGIVSAKQRDTGDYLPFIQTDVAINPGNSGGPLINMRGEVVGINSQIYSPSGGYAGISFSIPIDEALRVADQLKRSGRVVRGRIGVQIDAVSKEDAEAIGLAKAQGVLVRSVEKGGPADKAGVEPGDVIVKFNGKLIEKVSELPYLVGNTKPGTKSTLNIFRRGAFQDLVVTVAEIEAEKAAAAKGDAPKTPSSALPATSALGLTLADLSDEQKRELNMRAGVGVEAAQGLAAQAGLQSGDIIISVADVVVQTAQQFEALVAKLDKTKPVKILFRRGDWAQHTLIRPK